VATALPREEHEGRNTRVSSQIYLADHETRDDGAIAGRGSGLAYRFET